MTERDRSSSAQAHFAPEGENYILANSRALTGLAGMVRHAIPKGASQKCFKPGVAELCKKAVNVANDFLIGFGCGGKHGTHNTRTRDTKLESPETNPTLPVVHPERSYHSR